MIGIVLGAYLLMSVVAFAMYGHDKRQADRGGWPGAIAAQRVFRHKWRKRRYVLVFWTIVAVHAAGWAWWLG